jgi:HEXXH motif-containing protein
MQNKIFETVEFIEDINKININQRLIKYSLFMKFIINNASDEKIVEFAKLQYQQSKEIPTGALTAIFSDPSFGFWLYISKCIENRLINNEAIPKSDLPHLLFLNDNDNFIYYHLLDLNRWILGASMLSQIDFNATMLIRDNNIYIPILGLIFNNINGKISQEVKLDFSTNTLKVGDILYNDLHKYINLANQGGINSHLENENIYIIPSLLLSGGKVLLDNEDPFITSCWSSLYKNPDGTKYQLTTREVVLTNYEKFSEACKIIYNVWPEMEFNIANTLRNIHIIESPYDDKHVSCTAANFFGSILVSFGNEYLLAEAIVHEYSHNVLNMVIANGEMFNGDVPEEEIYYSPWRNDPRHISGLLHAVFVFNNVCKLFDKIIKDTNNDFVYERQASIIVKLIMGINVLKEFDFQTNFAKNFILDLEKDIKGFQLNYSKDEIDHYYSIQLKHLEQWMSNNHHIKFNDKILVNQSF